MKRKTIAEHAADVLRETDNPAVMWGDTGLLDTIAERANVKAPAWPPMHRWQRVLNALERSPLFVKHLSILKRGMAGNQACRVFTLKEPTP